MKKSKILGAIIALLVTIIPAHAVPLDFNADGVSDFVMVTINNDSTLTWNIYSKDGTLIDTVTSFGTNGNHLAPGSWVRGTTLLAALQNSSSKIQWRVRRNAAQYEILDIGSSKDILIGGGDFDGDSSSDATSISIKGKSYNWRVYFSPLSKSTSKLNRFGRSSDIPFFINANGKRDSLAVLRSGNKVLLRDVITRKTTTINLPSTFSSRPLPIRQRAGHDIFAFIESGSTQSTVTAINLKGRIIKQTTVPATGISVVGEFMKNKSGEEIAIQTASGFVIVNPVSGATDTINLATGIPVDEININAFESSPDACENESRNPSDGNEGFLWKPVSESTGKLAIHTPRNLTGKIAYVEVVSPQGTTLERGVYGGNGNGGRDLFRFSKPGRSYPNSSAAVVSLDAGCKITYVIPDTSKRWD